jgi:hypothetical protein
MWKQRQEIEEKKIRFKLEKAYEQEKSKVKVISLLILVCHHEKVQQNIPRIPKDN